MSEPERSVVDLAIRIAIFVFWGGMFGAAIVLVAQWWRTRQW